MNLEANLIELRNRIGNIEKFKFTDNSKKNIYRNFDTDFIFNKYECGFITFHKYKDCEISYNYLENGKLLSKIIVNTKTKAKDTYVFEYLDGIIVFESKNDRVILDKRVENTIKDILECDDFKVRNNKGDIVFMNYLDKWVHNKVDTKENTITTTTQDNRPYCKKYLNANGLIRKVVTLETTTNYEYNDRNEVIGTYYNDGRFSKFEFDLYGNSIYHETEKGVQYDVRQNKKINKKN